MIKPDKNKKHNLWIFYYIFLGIIQATWTSMTSQPPLPLRFLMLAAVFGPMLIRKEYIVFGIPFFMILRGQLATDYQYMPDIRSFEFYIPLLLCLLFYHGKKINLNQFKWYIPLAAMIFYICMVDIFAIGTIGIYGKNLLVAIIFSAFITSEDDSKILANALMSVCALLAVYYLMMYDRFLDTWDTTHGIERSGWNDPNYFSTLLGIGFLIALLQIFNHIKGKYVIFPKSVLILIAIIIYVSIVLTASRAGFIAATVTLIFTIIKSKVRFTTILVSIALIGVCIAIMAHKGVFDALLFRMVDQGGLDTGGGRTFIWTRTLQNFETQPHINQILGGGYWHRAKLSGGADLHNELFSVGADYGYLGFILFVGFIVSLLLKKDDKLTIKLLATTYYILAIMSLSPFQYINISFFLIWIISLKLSSSKK